MSRFVYILEDGRHELTAVCDENNCLYGDLFRVTSNVCHVERQHDDVGPEKELGHPQGGQAAPDGGDGQGVQEDGGDHADELAGDDDGDAALQAGPPARQVPDAAVAEVGGYGGDDAFDHG